MRTLETQKTKAEKSIIDKHLLGKRWDNGAYGLITLADKKG